LGFLGFFCGFAAQKPYNMDVHHFYWLADFEMRPESKIQNQIKKIGAHFSPLF
jgi:hypothetical protein